MPDSGQLECLLSTNKSLAAQKRQLHQEKLRVYAEKAVKIRHMMRCAHDLSEKKCLQSKLTVIEDKQNREIGHTASCVGS